MLARREPQPSVQAMPRSPSLINLSKIIALCVALSATTATGCRTEGEVFVAEVTLVGDATEGYGPYEVSARLQGRRALERATLYWTVDGMEEPTAVPMSRAGDAISALIEAPVTLDEEGLETRAPFALGTTVRYWIEVQAAGSGLARAPFEAPRETFFFVVGPARQRVAVRGVSPESGPSIGGTRVFVHGEGFRPTAEVILGGSLAGEVSYVSPHLLEVVTPAGPSGLVEIIVRNPSGSVGRLPDAFFFVAPPTPTRIEPNQGPTQGGTRVTIEGSGFDEGVEVSFDGEPGLDVSVIDAQTVFVTTPPHAAGLVDVAMVNPDGQVGGLAGGFEFVPAPRVDEVIPALGPIEGGTLVEVLGADFREGLTLILDREVAEVISVEAARIVATTPPHAAGLVDVTVINPDGQRATGIGLFTYLGPPELLDVQPDSGTTLGGTSVALIGRGFFEGMTITLDGLECGQVAVEGPTRARCVTPAHPQGAVDVSVTNIDGQTATLEGGFEYVPPPPEIVDIDPDRGPDLGGTSVTLVVRFGQSGLSVFFDGRAAQVVSVVIEGDEALVTAITPAHPEGLSDVIVVNPDGLRDIAPNAFLFVGPPIIDAIDPDQGPDTGGQEVTITGRNFLVGMQVTFDGVEAEVIEVDPVAGIARVRTPAHPVGFVDVSVVNTDGRSDVAEGGYEYILLPPEIEAIEPDEGAVWGDTEVTIRGSSFREGVQVLVNGVPVEVERVDGGTLRIVTPPGEAGLATIEIVNPDGQSDVGDFTYVAPSFAPEGGLTAGMTTVTITGRGFDEGTEVSFGGLPALSVIFVAEDRILAVSPPNAIGPSSVEIQTGAGLGGVFEGAFEYRVFAEITEQVGLPEERDCLATASGDIDGDGDVDVIVGNGGFNGLGNFNIPNAIYRNNGAGTFTRTAMPLAENTMGLDLADLDGDGDLDLLVLNLDGLNRLYLNGGQGDFTEASVRLPIQRASYNGAMRDVNNDGLIDIFLVNTSEPENLFINIGAGRFTDRSNLLPPDQSEHDHDFTFGDFNGDGQADMAMSVDNTIENDRQPRYDALNRIFLSQGGRYAAAPVSDYGTLRGDFLDVEAGDLNGDGLDDLVAVDNIDNSAPVINPLTNLPRNGIVVLINQGQGRFARDNARVPQAIHLPMVTVDLVDIDDDGDLDLIASASALIGDLNPDNPRGQPNRIFVNRGDGFFSDASGSWPVHRDLTWDVSAFDANGDGSRDLFVCNYLSPNRLLIQTATP